MLRRLLPYLVLFLALLGLYYGLTWRQAREEAQKAEAKKIFQVKEAEIDALVLKKGKAEVRLAKKDGGWFLTKPLEMPADKATLESILNTLAHLNKERDLGNVEDLKAYGLDKPALELEYFIKDQGRKLAIGNATPGEMGFYAVQDQAPRHLLVIDTGSKESLDRPEKELRDKTLFAYTPEKVNSLRLKTPGAPEVQLDKVDAKSWRWVGREKFPVRGDRVEELIRSLHLAKAKDFVMDAPKDLKPYGLAPPRGEVAVIQDKEPERLFLGDKAKEGEGGYARKAPAGPVVVADKDLVALIAKTLTTLEDRRLWQGQAAVVRKAVWGPPDKTWTAIKEKDFWKITGPEKQEVKQAAVRLEVGLWKLQALEFTRPAPAPPAKPMYLLELLDEAGKPLFRLEELGREKQEVLVRAQVGDKTETGLVPEKTYLEWQKEMTRLAAPPEGGAKAAPAPHGMKGK
jgi:hypothetical protein